MIGSGSCPPPGRDVIRRHDIMFLVGAYDLSSDAISAQAPVSDRVRRNPSIACVGDGHWSTSVVDQ